MRVLECLRSSLVIPPSPVVVDVPAAVAPRPRPYKGSYKPYSLTKLPILARKVMSSAGLSNELRLSDLRRTGTVEMVEAGVSMGNIMSVTGHANPQSVKPYIKNTYDSANYALTARRNRDI